MKHVFSKYVTVWIGCLLWAMPLAANEIKIDIRYQAPTLSVDIRNAPMEQVLKRVSDTIGFEIFLDEVLKSVLVNCEFQNLPLEEGIKKIIRTRNFAMVFNKGYDDHGKVTFFLASLKVYDSRFDSPTYIHIGGKALEREAVQPAITKRSPFVGTSSHQPEQEQSLLPQRRKAPDYAKRASLSALRSRMMQENASLGRSRQRVSAENRNTQRQMQNLERRLAHASEDEAVQIRSQLSELKLSLESSRQRMSQDMRRRQLELTKLRNKIDENRALFQ